MSPSLTIRDWKVMWYIQWYETMLFWPMNDNKTWKKENEMTEVYYSDREALWQIFVYDEWLKYWANASIILIDVMIQCVLIIVYSEGESIQRNYYVDNILLFYEEKVMKYCISGRKTKQCHMLISSENGVSLSAYGGMKTIMCEIWCQ